MLSSSSFFFPSFLLPSRCEFPSPDLDAFLSGLEVLISSTSKTPPSPRSPLNQEGGSRSSSTSTSSASSTPGSEESECLRSEFVSPIPFSLAR
jgi:hypothetical protein